MSHNYLFATHNFIEQRIASVAKTHEKAETGSDLNIFTEGRLNALREFRDYISNNLNSKLPRRLHNQLKQRITS